MSNRCLLHFNLENGYAYNRPQGASDSVHEAHHIYDTREIICAREEFEILGRKNSRTLALSCTLRLVALGSKFHSHVEVRHNISSECELAVVVVVVAVAVVAVAVAATYPNRPGMNPSAASVCVVK
uniref:Uncharacterized protein n=1 Tax=Anopheles farauti TaxID=69004 RepID=A0A182Q0D9_9DIPT